MLLEIIWARGQDVFTLVMNHLEASLAYAIFCNMWPSEVCCGDTKQIAVITIIIIE
jgi:hypothetical protein